MRRYGRLVSCCIFLSALPASAGEPLPPLDAYVGAEGCRACHTEKYEGWKHTFHSTVVQNARENPSAVLGDFSSGTVGFTPSDIEFTIGGHWNQRYMKRIGEEYYVLPKLWSVASRRWEPYNVWSWRKKPYSRYCVGCHSTRYDPAARAYVEHTVGCESCHGPGRAHAESSGTASIVNPAKLGNDGLDLLCASCHVRGRDPSGTYLFPVGFVPGRNLWEYYVPNRVDDEETPRDAFLREFRAWRARLEGGSSECDVCGLYGDKAKKNPKTVTEYCMGCHKYGDAYPEHTRHAAEVPLECTDCHRKVEIGGPEPVDVHSIGYFLVHKRTCYDRDFQKACNVCHTDFADGRIEAQLTVWKGAPDGVHD